MRARSAQGVLAVRRDVVLPIGPDSMTPPPQLTRSNLWFLTSILSLPLPGKIRSWPPLTITSSPPRPQTRTRARG
jgi:hypothetical protein